MHIHEELQHEIRDLVENNEVVLFMKGTKSFTQCGFSGKVVEILKELKIDFTDVDVSNYSELEEALTWQTTEPVPQLYVRGNFIGSCDLICALHEAGELKKMFERRNKK